MCACTESDVRESVIRLHSKYSIRFTIARVHAFISANDSFCCRQLQQQYVRNVPAPRFLPSFLLDWMPCTYLYVHDSWLNFVTAQSEIWWAICVHQLGGWINGILIWTHCWWQKWVSCHRLPCEFYETLSSKKAYSFPLNVVSATLMGICCPVTSCIIKFSCNLREWSWFSLRVSEIFTYNWIIHFQEGSLLSYLPVRVTKSWNSYSCLQPAIVVS
jgi:hypothetical protein